MKLTKRKVLFSVLHLIFTAAVPIALILVQYGAESEPKAAGFKVGFAGILLLVLVFWIIKRVFIDRKLKDLNAQGNIMLANLKTESDPDKLKLLEKEIRFIKTLEVVTSAVLPLLLLLACIVAFKALEARLVKLSAAMCFIAVSEVIGVVFGILSARQIRGKNGGAE